jgi:lipoprotein-anchoring transpeptidase ErfK/SrfK
MRTVILLGLATALTIFSQIRYYSVSSLHSKASSPLPAPLKTATPEGVRDPLTLEKTATTTPGEVLEEKKIVLKAGQTFGMAYSAEKNWEKALTFLKQEIEKFPELRESLSFELAKTYVHLNQNAMAQPLLEELLRSTPQHREAPFLYYYLAQIAQQAGDPVRSKEYLDKLQADYPQSLAVQYLSIDRGIALLQQGELGKAWVLLSESLFEKQTTELYEKALPPLREAVQKIFALRKPPEEVSYYEVQPGDNLSKIAQQYQLSPGLLMYLNKLSSTSIRIGQYLKVFQGGALSVSVFKSQHRLVVFSGKRYIVDYPVGLGKDQKTPEGSFEIQTKVSEPPWYFEGKKYEYGDPQNILGTRWMGFKNQPGITGFGIHGTSDPRSIGKDESNGCVRMKNEDVEALFTMLMIGTRVFIQN